MGSFGHLILVLVVIRKSCSKLQKMQKSTGYYPFHTRKKILNDPGWPGRCTSHPNAISALAVEILKRPRAWNTWWEIKLIVIDSTHHPTICWRAQRAQDGTTLAIKVISRFFRLKLPPNLASGFDPRMPTIVRGYRPAINYSPLAWFYGLKRRLPILLLESVPKWCML